MNTVDEKLDEKCKKYWEGKGAQPYLMEAEKVVPGPVWLGYQKIIVDKINEIKPKSLIEVGCGSGFWFETFSDVPEVYAFDRSKTMLKYSREVGKKYGYTVFQSDITDIDNIKKNTKRNQFDLVVCTEVLLHVPPAKIVQAFNTLKELSSGYILIFTNNPRDFSKQTITTFNHNYKEILKDIDIDVLEYIPLSWKVEMLEIFLRVKQ